ncbi:hypothetical protein [Paenibacillus periandrae]|uniref:hypothetical protein n=1 Tax=Paenibacillus periandrae TaxID=1761741 RepID=UPI001F097D8B|nr:hypothetical protein [Paenibacillus periandrae]
MTSKKVYAILIAGLLSLTPNLQLPVSAQSLTDMSPIQISHMEDIHIEKYENMRNFPNPYSDEGKEWLEKTLAPKTEQNEIQLLDYDYREDIYEQLVQYEEEHPSAHPREVYDFFIQLCKLYNRQHMQHPLKQASPIKSDGSDGFYPIDHGRIKLDADLTRLYNSDPVTGFKSLLAREEAVKTTISLFKQIGHQDHTEAFLEMATNVYLIRYTNSYLWAKYWTKYPALSGDEKNSVHRNQQLQAMNANNALVGRLAASNANITIKSTPNEIKTLLFHIYYSGELMKLYKSDVDGEDYAKTFTGHFEDIPSTRKVTN